MDELASYNKKRWEELARSNVEWSRPFLDLDPNAARKMLDPLALMGEIAGKHVLCLASGGGQQSVAFGLLGAQVTVFDLSETQLERDRQAAEHHNFSFSIVQGDMRDLSAFDTDAFDIVWQPYSINFVPDVRPVFDEVRRVLRRGGTYVLEFANPYIHTVDEEAWDGQSYPLSHPYIDGQEITTLYPHWDHWDVESAPGKWVKVKSPKEFRHTLSTMINGLARRGFIILGVHEEVSTQPQPEPGTWEHFKSIAPPWLKMWLTYRS